MSFDIVIVIIITAFIQSIFGVGVLLFGTPLLLLLGYGFIDAIIILLPISISINLIQIAKDYRSVDFDFYKKILIFSIPFVIVFLFLVTKVQINIGLIGEYKKFCSIGLILGNSNSIVMGLSLSSSIPVSQTAHPLPFCF